MKPAAHGADRQVEHARDGLVVVSVNFSQNEYSSIFFGQASQSCLHLADPFLLFNSSRWRPVSRMRLIATGFTVLIDRNHRLAPSSGRGGHIHRNPEKPCVKRTG